MSRQEPGKEPAVENADGAPSAWNPKVRQKFETKSRSEFLDPCQEAATKSIRCLHRNGGDRAMCQDFFQAYRDCKKDWLEKRQQERKREGSWFK